MSHVLVAGLINIETTVQVEGFPVEYTPVRYPFFGVKTTVSGVGLNVSNALTTPGNRVDLYSLIGRDSVAQLARIALKEAGLHDRYVLDTLDQTPQSVILYDGTGRRMINTDLKLLSLAWEQRAHCWRFGMTGALNTFRRRHCGLS